MTELNQSTDNANVSKPSDTNVETTANTSETGKRCCGWKREHWQAKCGKGQGKCCRLKVIAAALLIFLLGVMAGKGCSHHHHKHHGAMNEQATVVVRGEKPLPLTALLDSIQATPEQRAKAADLVY